ncbi:response regulator [Puniceicoccaceae bacterium K14]|nr:response regulator [Puniceicoccaceae bacterium K14]
MRKPRVFVIEDDRPSRRMICKILEKAGYDPIECPEGRDAIHMALMHPPEAMLVDVMLPDMQGTEVVKELEARKDCQFIEYIFLTAILSERAGNKNSKFFFEVEDKRYQALPKPIKKRILLELLEGAVEKSRSNRKKVEESDRHSKLETKRQKIMEELKREDSLEEKNVSVPSSNDEWQSSL